MKVYDIETIKGCFLACYLEDDKFTDFEISHRKNDLYKLIKYLEGIKNSNEDIVGFNILSFDSQIIRFIWDNYDKWIDLSSIQISSLISEYGSKIIDNQNYGLFLPYRENELIGRNIDIFKIQHFDNKNRRVGLKRLEYEMDAENVHDMPVRVGKIDFTSEEIEDLIKYCHNDCIETKNNYLHIIGEIEHPLYKGNNQIEIRDAITEKFGFDSTNYSNSKFGDEIIKTLYCQEAKIQYNQLPRKGTFRKTVKFKDGIPSYVKFQTPDLQSFLKRMKDKEIKASDEFEESVKLFGQIHTFALGGLDMWPLFK